MSREQKKIAWESWNAKVQDILSEEDGAMAELEELLGHIHSEEMSQEDRIIQSRPRIVQTPYGAYFLDSLLKPSNRWDCWICYTNFDITRLVTKILESIEGVEALKIMGRYTFFVGVGKLFDIKDVRLNMETLLCDYSDENIDVEPDMSETINNLKEQVADSNYWSIFISPEGEIEYIMSDNLDECYLNGLDEFEQLRSKFGGIILRSNNE